MPKRKYTKRSSYWNKFNTDNVSVAQASEGDGNFLPMLLGQGSYNLHDYESIASITRTRTGQTSTRQNKVSTGKIKDRFKSIDEGFTPYSNQGNSEYITCSDVIELCQKAYYNVAVYRATIDLLAEFADSEIYLKGGTAKSKKFVEEWLEKIDIDSLKAQVFLEYYRSQNIFLYRLKAKISPASVRNFNSAFGASADGVEIPVRYVMMNPAEIGVRDIFVSEQKQYVKLLVPYEISRLKNPKTEHEKMLLDSLSDTAKKQIQGTHSMTDTDVLMDLDSDDLVICFGKKQDYEPFAVPVGFSVLDDINKKMELKKVDQAISRSIENVILLVTMGSDEVGVNPEHIKAMQEIFENKSVGRVLVSDFTTKADFVIPDLRKVVGKEKYEVLNKDITDGLQNVLLGESKYADTEIKMRIFMQRLEESRGKFLKMIQKEINDVCEQVKIQNPPKLAFKKTDTLDNESLQRLTTRMMELGILSPEQGMDVIHKGVFPTAEEIGEGQEKYKKAKEKGHFVPIVNTVSFVEDLEANKPDKTGGGTHKDENGKPNATLSSPSGGRPTGANASSFSRQGIVNTLSDFTAFQLRSEAAFMEKFGADSIGEKKKAMIYRICNKVYSSKDKEDWDSSIASIVEDVSLIDQLETKEEVQKIADEFLLSEEAAAILYHSDKASVEKG